MKMRQIDCLGTLRAAAVRVDITDIGEISYRGFLLKECEIIDRIYAKVSYLFADEKSFILINLDECSVRTKDANVVLNRLHQLTNIPISQMSISCAHVHSAHDVGLSDLEKFADLLYKGISAARAKLTPIHKIRQVVGENQYIINRRVYLSQELGGYCVMFNDHCKIDEEAIQINATEQVVRFAERVNGTLTKTQDLEFCLRNKNIDKRIHLWCLLDASDQVVLSFLRVNAHPVIVSQSRVGKKISSDYVGHLEKLVEKKYGGVCSTWNGAFGDARPLTKDYTFEERDRFAQRYFEALEHGIQTESAIEKFSWFSFEDVSLPLRTDIPHSIDALKEKHVLLTEEFKNQERVTKRGLDQLEVIESFLLDSKNSVKAIVNSDEVEKGVASYLFNGWILGPMRIFAIAGEPLFALTKRIEALGDVLTVGISNGYLSYLPNTDMISDGGYEANQAVLSKEGLEQLIDLSRYFHQNSKG